jgi:hypothetical protein
MRANPFDVGNVFRYAGIFLSCFFELFGQQLAVWDPADVAACWDFPEAEGRRPKNLPPNPL